MLPWLGLALILLIADQFTKVLILGYYQPGRRTYVTSFFNIVRAHNTGAAFSFLAPASGWQRWFFTGIGVAAAVFIVWMLRSHAGQKLFSFALACILGGAIGNVIDRMLHGYVVDFLDFHCARLAFPGLQRGRQRHHRRRGLPDPGRAAAGAARSAKPCTPPKRRPMSRLGPAILTRSAPGCASPLWRLAPLHDAPTRHYSAPKQ